MFCIDGITAAHDGKASLAVLEVLDNRSAVRAARAGYGLDTAGFEKVLRKLCACCEFGDAADVGKEDFWALAELVLEGIAEIAQVFEIFSKAHVRQRRHRSDLLGHQDFAHGGNICSAAR